MKHEKALKDLKAAKGQIESAIRMIEEGRYCIDISKQILATIAHLKKAHNKVLKQHIETCIREAVETGNVDTKLEELEEVLDYFSKTL
ncbi:MAG: CsoR family transcriptional regulator, copper-sensing transcriptional repressor [Thermotogota bacterium]|nr:CsoR family transcriptional regulator, copper-sensing transcriptional repressor [Thermotogota bacterium]MDK2863913.1 CsoR family transcriptional regulator, copper-sensing transcriptional repressor [Thermotogota bacterium]HCZ06652.1 CsoR family transcriptional regulator [Thermotogota bacterium]